MTRDFVRFQDFRFAGICHLVGLLFVVVHCIPPPGVTASPESNGIAPDSSRMLHINDDEGDSMQAKSERVRQTREAVLPLGHRYIGLGKRLEADVEGIARDANKRRYSPKEGSAMRFTGLGKRGGGGGGGHSGLRFIGLGKRNQAAMRFIGLGKRIPGSYGDGEGDGYGAGSIQDLDSDEIEDIIGGSQDYYSVQDRISRK